MTVETLNAVTAPLWAQRPYLVEEPPSAAVDQCPDETRMQAAVDQAVEAMRKDLFCDVGIAGIAAGTFYSKFHFTREFSRITGATPRRFLAALRMERASRLLLTTDVSISDAGTMVGYASVGTFSTRFSALVGVSPRQWRACAGRPETIGTIRGDGQGRLRGVVELAQPPSAAAVDIFVGAFEDGIIQGRPVASTRLTDGDAFELEGVPAGAWTVAVLARVEHALADGKVHVEWLRSRTPMHAFDDPHTRALPKRIGLRKVRPSDPPVLLGGTHAEPAAFPARRRNREYARDLVFGQR